SDASYAITASADFSAKIWDTFTGECLQTLPHNHIVRAVSFSPQSTHATTGGQEKKLRLYDLSRPNDPVEVGQGTHQGTIKSIIWTDPNTVVSAADDKTLRWWDLRSGNMIEKYGVEDL